MQGRVNPDQGWGGFHGGTHGGPAAQMHPPSWLSMVQYPVTSPRAVNPTPHLVSIINMAPPFPS